MNVPKHSHDRAYVSGVGVPESAASLHSHSVHLLTVPRASPDACGVTGNPSGCKPCALNSSDDHGCVPMKTVAGSRADIAGHTNVLAVSDWLQIGLLKDSSSFVLQLQCISKSPVLSKDHTTFSRPGHSGIASVWQPLSAMPHLACL